MPAPVTPNDFKGLISDATSSLCGNFINTLLKLPVMLWQLVDYMFDSSGNPTKALVNASLPTGSLVMSACLQDEDGTRLLCDGRQFSQTDDLYVDLYAAIGSTYGTASAGNFKIPDFRARFPVGIGTFSGAGTASLGVAGGEDQHKLSPNEVGSLDVTITGDDGDAATGSRISLETITFNGTTFGDAGSLASQGPTNIKLKNDAAKHDLLPPFLPCYIYIVL